MFLQEVLNQYANSQNLDISPVTEELSSTHLLTIAEFVARNPIIKRLTLRRDPFAKGSHTDELLAQLKNKVDREILIQWLDPLRPLDLNNNLNRNMLALSPTKVKIYFNKLKAAIGKGSWNDIITNIKRIEKNYLSLDDGQLLEYAIYLAGALEWIADLENFGSYEEHATYISKIFINLESQLSINSQDNRDRVCKFFYHAAKAHIRYNAKIALRYANQGWKLAHKVKSKENEKQFKEIIEIVIEYESLKSQVELLFHEIKFAKDEVRHKNIIQYASSITSYHNHLEKLKKLNGFKKIFARINLKSLVKSTGPEQESLQNTINNIINIFTSNDGFVENSLHKLCENLRDLCQKNRIDLVKDGLNNFIQLANECVSFINYLISTQNYKNADKLANMLLTYLSKLQEYGIESLANLNESVNSLIILIDDLDNSQNETTFIIDKIDNFLKLLSNQLSNEGYASYKFTFNSFIKEIILPNKSQFVAIFDNKIEELTKIYHLFYLIHQALELDCQFESHDIVNSLIDYFDSNKEKIITDIDEFILRLTGSIATGSESHRHLAIETNQESSQSDYLTQLYSMRDTYISDHDSEAYSNRVVQLIQNIANPIVKKLSQSSNVCGFALIGVGSISRLMLSLHSDLDMALLIELKDYKQHPFFRHFIQLMELNLISIGDFDQSLKCNGFGIDTSDNTYLIYSEENKNREKAAAMINTPDDMLAEWFPDGNSEQVYLAESYGLLRPILLIANNDAGKNLINTYYTKLGSKLGIDKNKALTLQVLPACLKVAKTYLEVHLASYNKPALQDQIALKDELLNPLVYACSDLLLFHGISNWSLVDNKDTIDKKLDLEMALNLTQMMKGLELIVTSDFVGKLNQSFKDLLRIRLKLHKYFGRAEDVIDIADFLEKGILVNDDIHCLRKIQRQVIHPLYHCLRLWNAETTPLIPLNVIYVFFKDFVKQLKTEAEQNVGGLDDRQKTEIESYMIEFVSSCKTQQVAVLEYLIVYHDLPTELRFAFYEKVKQLEEFKRFSIWIKLIIKDIVKKYPPKSGLLARDVTESLTILIEDLVAIMQKESASIDDYESVAIELNDSLWQIYRYYINLYETEERKKAIFQRLDEVPYINGTRNSINQLKSIFQEELKKVLCPQENASRREDPLQVKWILRNGKKMCGNLHQNVVNYLVNEKYIDSKTKKWNVEAKKAKNTRGRHLVIPITVEIDGRTIAWHLKVYPELPGMEIAATTLTHLLIGHYSPFVELIKVNLGNEWYPVLISQTMPGVCLQDYFDPKNNSGTNFDDDLDDFMMSQMMLARPILANEDEKPDNFNRSKTPDGRNYIVCTDNDRSFYPVVLKEGANIVPILKSILFFTSFWRRPINERAIKHWLRLDAHQLLTDWLNQIEADNRRFTALFSADELEALSVESKFANIRYSFSSLTQLRQPSIIPIPLQQGTVSQLIIRIEETQRHLKLAFTNNQKSIFNELINKIEPWLASFYDYYYDQKPDALSRFHEAFGVFYGAGDKNEPHISLKLYQTLKTRYGKPIDITQLSKLPTLSVDAARSELKKVTSEPRDMEELSINLTAEFKIYLQTLVELPEDRCIQTINRLDFRKFSKAQQEMILQVLLEKIRKKEFAPQSMQELRLAYCTALTDEILLELLQKAPFLTNLNVAACSNLTLHFISQLPELCKNLARLNISNLPKLINFYRGVYIGSNKIIFERLRYLRAENCSNLKQLHIQCNELQELSIHGCRTLKQLSINSKSLLRLDVTVTYLDTLDNLIKLIETFPTLTQVTNATVRKLGEEIKDRIMTSIFTGDYSIIRKLVILGININQRDNSGKTALIHVISSNEENALIPSYLLFFLDRTKIVKELLASGADPNQGDEPNRLTPLMSACMKDDSEIVDILINTVGIRINQTTVQGFTALHVACINGLHSIALKLIAKGANINFRSQNGATPLMLACQGGYIETVKVLVEAGAKLDLADEDGNNPLISACANEKVDIIKYLLSKGANINYIGNEPVLNPLMAAISNNSVEVTKLLLADENIDINIRDCQELSPLAQTLSFPNYDMCDLLIEKGARLVNPITIEQQILLQAIKELDVKLLRHLKKAGLDFNQSLSKAQNATLLILACQSRELALAELLCELGADVNICAQDEAKTLPIVFAALHGLLPFVELFINKGASVNSANENDGLTPLMAACISKDIELVRYLINLGAEVNQVNKKGLTALHLAIIKKDAEEVIIELLNRGANLEAADEDGDTPIIFASQTNNLTILKLLISKRPDIINQINNKGQTALHTAASKGYEDIVDELLNHFINIDVSTDEGFTPLMVACQEGHTSIASKLIQKGAYINQTDKKRLRSPLLLAAGKNKLATIDLLLQHGADINFASSHANVTPIFFAIINGHLSVVQKLVQEGADIHLTTVQGLTPLMAACKYGYSPIAEFLLPLLDDINQTDNTGYTALIYACIKGDINCVKLLLAAGADSTKLTYALKISPLMMASLHGHFEIVEFLLTKYAEQLTADDKSKALAIAEFRNNKQIAQCLTQAGAKRLSNSITSSFLIAVLMASSIPDLDSKLEELMEGMLDNPNQMIKVATFKVTPLIFAILTGRVELTRKLIRVGADIDLSDEDGDTALIIACQLANLAQVDLLIEYGANVNLANYTGLTPLMAAAANDNTAIIKKLIEAGANINCDDKRGKTALIIAAIEGQDENIELLIKSGADVNPSGNSKMLPLIAAAGNGRLSTVQLLISQRALVNGALSNGRTSLFFACSYNQFEVVEYLIGIGANVNVIESDNNATPLILAAESGSLKIVQLLIENHANLDLKTKQDATALFYAIDKGYTQIALVLINAGANIQLADQRGYTPFLLACLRGDLEVIQALEKAGSDIYQIGKKNNETGLLLACAEGKLEVVNYLLCKQVDVNQTDKNKVTPLMAACRKEGSIQIVRSLLEAHARIDLLDNEGDSAFIYAVMSGDESIFNLLLDKGADVHISNSKGMTALIIACSKNLEFAIKALIAKGCNINHANQDGMTSLIAAIYKGSLPLIQYLISQGANVEQKTTEGYTPLTIASSLNRRQIVYFLLNYMLENGKLPEQIASSIQPGEDEIKLTEITEILCKSHKQLSDLHNALQHYELLVTFEPTYSHALHNLACYYHAQAENEKESNNQQAAENKIVQAETCFRRALDALAHCSTLAEFANFLIHNERYAEAIPYLKQTLASPDDKSSLFYAEIEINTVDMRLREEILRHKKINVNPHIFAYQLLIRTYCKLNQIIEAESLIIELQKLVKQENDFVSYLLLSFAYSDLNNSVQAEYFAMIAKKKSDQALEDEAAQAKFEDFMQKVAELPESDQINFLLLGALMRTLSNARSKQEESDDEDKVQILEERHGELLQEDLSSDLNPQGNLLSPNRNSLPSLAALASQLGLYGHRSGSQSPALEGSPNSVRNQDELDDSFEDEENEQMQKEI